MGRVTVSADQRPLLAMHGVRLSPLKTLFCLIIKNHVAAKWCVNEFRAYGYKYKCNEVREIQECWTATPYHYDMGRVTISADQRTPARNARSSFIT